MTESIAMRPGETVTVRMDGTVYTVTMTEGQWPATTSLAQHLDGKGPQWWEPQPRPKRRHHDHLIPRHIRSPRRGRR